MSYTATILIPSDIGPLTLYLPGVLQSVAINVDAEQGVDAEQRVNAEQRLEAL